MKKVLLFALMTIMSFAANAQQLKLDRSKSFASGASAMQQAPALANSIAGTDMWGYYLDESMAGFAGLGTGSAGSFRVAIKVPGDGILAGAKIHGVNIPVLGAVTDASAWLSTGLTNSSRIVTKTFTANKKGWYLIKFDEPIEIPAAGLYAGYTFTSSEAYPIATVGDDIPGGLFLSTSATGNLQDYSAGGFGVCPVQVFVEGMHLFSNGATISNAICYGAAAGQEGSVVLDLNSDCNNGVSSVGYTVTINGSEQTGTATLNPSIPGGLLKKGFVEIPVTAPNEIGTYNATVKINTVNGQPNEAGSASKPFTVSTVSRVVPRMSVVEEYTGTQCGYCPRGWVGMEAVKNNLSDKALVIAWHNYNSSDAMYQANYASIPFDGAPQCTVDRKTYPDPYYGEGKEGILECTSKYNKFVPTVEIKNLKANFVDDTNKEVKISSDTEFLANTKGYTVAYVLTADDLSGTTTAWKQSNYYYQYALSDGDVIPSMPDLANFYSGHSMGKSSVALTFNDAMIGSTYNNTGKTTVPALTKGSIGDVESSEGTITMPTKAALVNALNYDKIYATVLVIDNTGKIANAARVRVLGAGEGGDDVDPVDPIEIDGMKVSDMDDDMQLMGEAMSPNAKYVVGMNFATYAPAIWDVEKNEYTEYPDFEEGAFHAANSNGLFVGDDGNFAIKADDNGNVVKLYTFEGEEVETEWGPMSTGDAGSSAYAVSEDGKTIAGYYFDSAYNTKPCIWTENNSRIDLPLPTMDEAGFEVNGGQVRYMTPDGKTLVGYLIDNMATWPACIWRQNATGGYDVDIICKDYWEEGYQMGKPYMFFQPSAISANGQWLALQIQNEFDDWDFSAPQPAMQIARLNLTTKALEVLPVEDESYSPTGIANDGTMLAYTGGNDMMERVGYVWNAGSSNVVSINDVMSKVPELSELRSNTPCSISADGKYVQGFGINGENIFSYVIDMSNAAGIESVKVDNKVASDRIYNINGQQLRSINGRGLYIINGKKIIK